MNQFNPHTTAPRGGVANLGYLIFLSVVASLGGFLFGYDTAVISGTISMVVDQYSLDTLQQGWYVGCALIGSIAGVSLAGILSDRLGRRPSMIISAFLFTASALGCMLCTGFPDLVLYRIIGGIGIGVVSIVSPLYISEMAVANCRGRLVSLYQLAITIGFLGAYLVNYLLQGNSTSAAATDIGFTALVFGNEVWRGMLGMETIPAFLFLAVIFAIPESPRWLIVRRREALAMKVLCHIYRQKSEAIVQYRQTESVLEQDRCQGSDWRMLLRPNILKAVIIGMAIAMLGQFMGVNAVLYYGPSIFEQAGLSDGDSLFYQVLVGLVNMLTTVIALLIIDKVGRKKLVYFGVTGMIVSLILIATYFSYGKEMNISTVFLLVVFLAYVFFCAISISAVVFVLLSEMYPTKVRGLAMSVAGLSLWIGTYLIGQLTPWLLSTLTPSGTFLLFAGMCIPYLIIMKYFVPETTGRSLEDIERFWTDTANF